MKNGNHVGLSSLSSKLSLEVSAKFTEMYRGNSALLSTVIRGFSWGKKITVLYDKKRVGCKLKCSLHSAQLVSLSGKEILMLG